ncbi:hypothetical protein PABG_06293 [Paracoccidioides brasiliensis Pb03]|nr:hypothetical protein PABG_06293 [Paracoccidioides brasiliensis Pb03]
MSTVNSYTWDMHVIPIPGYATRENVSHAYLMMVEGYPFVLPTANCVTKQPNGSMIRRQGSRDFRVSVARMQLLLISGSHWDPIFQDILRKRLKFKSGPSHEEGLLRASTTND